MKPTQTVQGRVRLMYRTQVSFQMSRTGWSYPATLIYKRQLRPVNPIEYSEIKMRRRICVGLEKASE